MAFWTPDQPALQQNTKGNIRYEFDLMAGSKYQGGNETLLGET
jgi:hypothetical protein